MVDSAPRTQASSSEKPGRNGRIFELLEVSEVSENHHFGDGSGLHFGPHFGPLDIILAAFLRLGRPPGSLFGTLAVQDAKMDVFGVPSGHPFWTHFGHQAAKEASKT